jgi:hypothetical protein
MGLNRPILKPLSNDTPEPALIIIKVMFITNYAAMGYNSFF